MKIIMVLLLGVSLLIPGASAQAAAGQPWVLYDNFDGTFIDPGKWLGIETGNDAGLMTDSVRELKGNRLHLGLAAYGDNSSDTGVQYPSSRVIFKDAADIAAIQATVIIGKFAVAGCSGNPDATNTARARITAPLFNVSAEGPQAGSMVGDILAQIRIQSQPSYPGTLKVYGKVQLCHDMNCDSTTDLFNKVLRTVNKDQSVTYSIVWDKSARQIKLTAGKVSGKAVSANYDYSEVYPGEYPLASAAAGKGLQVSGVLASCTDEPWPRVNMEAFFENVYVKKSSDSGI
jgi:hypothetical protein